VDTGSGDGAGAGGKAWLYTDDLSGVLLAGLTELRYSTYVDSTSTAASHLAPALNLQIDWDDDGTRDTILVWEPVYVAAGRGAVTADTWQEWDALSDAWWYTSAFGSLVTPGGQFEPLGYYLDRYPNARIVNWGGHTPGTAMVSGQSSGGVWAGFVGAVDGFTYAVANGTRTTVDFEPPFVGLDDFATTQITPVATVDLSVPINLSAINGSILAVPPYDTFVGIERHGRLGAQVGTDRCRLRNGNGSGGRHHRHHRSHRAGGGDHRRGREQLHHGDQLTGERRARSEHHDLGGHRPGIYRRGIERDAAGGDWHPALLGNADGRHRDVDRRHADHLHLPVAAL
jgi:hypothetical protein